MTNMLLPGKIWGTKGFLFWTFLSLLLLGAGSKRILELGSGRSTITFAEYARHRRATFVSLETSEAWYNKAKLELHFLGIPSTAVRLIELDSKTGWYRLDRFRSHVQAAAAFDCVLIDAPNDENGDSKGMRDSPVAITELSACCRHADLVIIDDVHRRHVYEMVQPPLSDAAAYEIYYFDYHVLRTHPNWLCFCVRSHSPAAKAIAAIQRFLRMKLDTDRSAELCPEP